MFVSTIEPLDEQGRSTNPTKSLSDKYVFNTVLTRSRSLVVAAGSPHALLHMEEQMEGNTCWRSYIQNCVDHGTFIVPQKVEPNGNKINKYLSELKIKLRELNRGMSSNRTEISSKPTEISSKPMENPKAITHSPQPKESPTNVSPSMDQIPNGMLIM